MGDKEVAFTKLELEVRRPPLNPDLILFLIDEFRNERLYTRAISTADLLADQDTSAGDLARYLKLLSMWEQAEQTAVYGGFPAKAVELARMIRDKDLQSKVSTIIGEAYEKLGDLQRASEAYRGILR